MSALAISQLFFLVLQLVFIVLKRETGDGIYGIISFIMMIAVLACGFANIYIK